MLRGPLCCLVGETTIPDGPLKEKLTGFAEYCGRHDGDEAYTLQVKENGTLEGKADCNTYGGIYAAEDGGSVSVDSLGTTQIYCGEASQETLYLSALDAAAAYAVEGNRLRIGYGERGVLAFSRQ